jgi:hypothetical protein
MESTPSLHGGDVRDLFIIGKKKRGSVLAASADK